MKNVKRKAEQGSAGDSPTKKKKDEDGKKTKQDSTTSDAGGSSSQQKRALKQERQSLRRHADSVGEAKAIWNKLRLKVNSKEETKKMVTDLMNLIEGKMHEISLQHDASRVVQAALQFGNLEQRIQVVTELCKSGQFPELCRVQYSHFVVLKMIKYCARDDVNTRMIVKSLKGETSKLAIHAVGSKVVDSVFRNFPPKITAPLKQEFYGPHFALFAADVVNTPTSDGSKKSTIPTLESNLKIAPDKKEPALEFILSILNKCIEKSLFGFSYFQELFSEYVAVASPTAVRSLIPSVADHTIHMLSTKAGTRGVISCISYGTAKDRKRIMKSLKGFVRSSLLHRDAYLAILRLVQVTDDTVSTFKSVLNEVLALPETEKDNETSPLLEIATHETGSKLLLLVLTEDNDVLRKYFDPYERSLLFGDTPTVEENGEQVPTSKKNPETRRRELVQHLREPLIELTAKNPSQLLWSVPGSRILREVYSCFHPKVLVDAVVNICELDLSEHATTEAGSDGDTHSRSLFEDPVAHHSVKNLLAVDANRAHTDGISFAKEFYNKLGDRFPQIGSSNRGAFVVTALVKVPTITSDVLKRLKKEKKLWQKLAEGPGATAGFKALLNEISPPPKV